jgi:hypothetical protein
MGCVNAVLPVGGNLASAGGVVSSIRFCEFSSRKSKCQEQKMESEPNASAGRLDLSTHILSASVVMIGSH